MKYLLKTGLLLLALFVSATLYAQLLPITGTVYDDNNQPLPGASIIIKGTPRGTTTDAKGKFSLQAEEGQTLAISFIGFTDKEMKVTGSMTNLSIRLETSSNAIEEVVVSVGYGQMAKKDISGAVSTVKTSDLEKGVVSANFSDALAGRMAGVQVTSSEGGPGAGVDITIRGGNSLTGSNAPLWVIDGFPIENPNTFSIDSKDIEQMQVLKDASATAIYGARGANGVIIIETKKGSDNGSVNVEYNGKFSVSTLPSERKMKMLKGLDYLQVAKSVADAYSSTGFVTFADRYLVNDLYKRDYEGGPYSLDADGKRIELTYNNAADWEKLTIEDYASLPWTMHDWQDEAFQTAITHSHRVAISGGNKSTKFNVSADAFLQDGLLITTGIDKYNFRASLDQQVSKKLRFVGQFNYNATRRHGLQSSEGNRNSIIRDILQYQPVNPMKYGDLGSEGIPSDVDTDTNNLTYQPIRNLNNSYREIYSDQITINGSLYYQIIKPLKLMIRGGYTHYTYAQDSYNNADSRYGHPILQTNGINAYKSMSIRDTWFNEYTLTYAKTWGRHRFDAMAGYSMDGYLNRSVANTYIKFPTDILGMDDLSQGTPQPAVNSIEEYFSMSFLGRVNYVYNDKYIFTASFRADGSSKFLGDNKFSYFPSGAVAWRASQENFLRDVHWLSNLKLRASWGLTGNNRIGGSSAYAALYNSASTGYPFNGNLVYGYQPSRIENPDLKWETTRQVDIGVDFAVFNNRIGLTVDYYHKKTKDLLLYSDLATSSGYESAYKNIGSVQNQGWEISVNTTNIDHKNFRWYTSFNISFNRNKVLGLNSGQDYMLSKPNWYQKYDEDQYIARVGQPASMIYGYIYDGVYQNEDFYYVDGKWVTRPGVPSQIGAITNIQPGHTKYRDINGDGKIDANDMTVIGNPNPKCYGGFTNNFEWHNFDLSVFFTWVAGNDILNANETLLTSFDSSRNNFLDKTLNVWTPQNPTNALPAIPSAESQIEQWVTSRSVEDGSYLRLQNITLGYSLNAKKVPFLRKIGLSSLRVYFAADNLYVWTDYTGYDPEVNTNSSALMRGLDYCSYPRSRTYTFGLDLKF
ncbi:MAG: TonB-dependent receptor [Alistipes sp.]|nr:TonB-dependent receptor [Alistipes sp.]